MEVDGQEIPCYNILVGRMQALHLSPAHRQHSALPCMSRRQSHQCVHQSIHNNSTDTRSPAPDPQSPVHNYLLPTFVLGNERIWLSAMAMAITSSHVAARA